MMNRFESCKAARCLAMALAFAVAAVVPESAAKAEQVSGHITYRIEEGVYVDMGSDKGLRQGTKGQLVLEDGRALVFEVLQASPRTALLRLDGQGAELTGTLRMLPVQLVFESEAAPDRAAVSAPVPSTAGTAEPEPFVPLLSPMKQAAAATRTENVGHGNIGVNQSMQTGTDNQLDRMVTRLYTSGNIDRLLGSGWSFNWSGNARYRSGDAYADHPEYQTLQPLIYSAMLQHPLDAGGFVRLGRFLPFELPGIGYIDGGQLEINHDNPWRFGVVAGLKPDRVDLSFTADEPTVAGYATLETGTRGSAYYSGTAGLLASLYQGEANRMALLFDQRASLGPKFDLFSTAEVDMGVADTTNSTTQLSRFDLTASYRVHRNHTLRTGADHWQRTDTPVERDRLTVVDDSWFDDGYWRYWIGGTHRLPWKLNLNEEVAYTVSDASEDAMRWRVGLTRTGILGWSTANLAATLYNLETTRASGYGGVFSAYLPFLDGRFSVRPSASTRWLDPDDGGEGLEVSYYAIYLDARLSKSWLLTGGFTETLGDGADSTLFDLGLRYSW